MPRTPPAPTMPPEDASFTCDWGDCDEETTAWRWSGQRLNESPLGWLPVCAKHAAAADAVVAHNDGAEPAQHAEFVCPEPECFDSACELFCKLRPADFVRGRDYERQVILRWLRTFWPNTAYEIANKIEALAHDQYAQSGWGHTDAR